MSRVNGTFDPEIAEMLDFYKTAAARSDARGVSSRADPRADLSVPTRAPHSAAYRPIPDRRQQRREHR
jgi:hypothetical protein